MAKRLYTDAERRARHNKAAAEWRERNPETEEQRRLRLEKKRLYRERTREPRAAYQKQYVAANGSRLSMNKRIKRADPQTKAQESRAYRKWFEQNRHIDAAKQHRRRAHKKQAIPGWYSELDDFIIVEAAELCKQREQATGVKWHIDHIVPLVSKQVCGLHIGCNIQVIPAVENQAKGNRHWPDMP